MANRRMFSCRIIGSARFLKMPISSQALYFHLGLHADDDGVVEAYNVIKQIGCSEDDLRVLVSKGFVQVLNEDLVSYITDWNENNYIRADRKIDSIYKDLLISMNPEIHLIEKRPRADAKTKLIDTTSSVLEDENDNGQPMDNQWTTNGQSTDGIGKDRLGKDRLGKDRLGKDRLGEDRTGKDKINYQEVIDMYNATCVSFPHLSKLSDARKKAIKARLKTYTLDEMQLMFQKAEASSFLKGKNNRNWSATFDWMIKDANMSKILDGNYDDRGEGSSGNKTADDLNDFYNRASKWAEE